MQNNIKQLRIQRGMSSTELAEKAGLSRAAINNSETGRKDPSMRSAIKISNALSVSLDALFAEHGADGEPRTTIRVDDSEIRAAQKEAVKLFKALEKANSLVDELASKFKN